MKRTSPLRLRRTSASALGLLLLCALGCASSSGSRLSAQTAGGAGPDAVRQERQKDEPVKPNPKLSPEEVISAQLEALQHNDTPEKDSGIARAFEFASPGNRAATGPLDNFIQLVKSAAYSPMLNHRRAERGPVRVVGEEAQQRVTLVDAQGRRVTYVFVLSKQAEGVYKDCWMTDAVVRVPPRSPQDEGPIAAGNGHPRGARLG